MKKIYAVLFSIILVFSSFPVVHAATIKNIESITIVNENLMIDNKLPDIVGTLNINGSAISDEDLKNITNTSYWYDNTTNSKATNYIQNHQYSYYVSVSIQNADGIEYQFDYNNWKTITVNGYTTDGVYSSKSTSGTLTVHPGSLRMFDDIILNPGNSDPLKVDIGKTIQLTAYVSPVTIADRSVTWESKDTAIATVDASTGVVTGLKTGVVEISAKDAAGASAECTVTVGVPSTSISISKSYVEIEKGKTETLEAVVKPTDSTDKSVTWSSLNKDVATVDENGVVTAVKVGSATIKAVTSNGIVSTCTVSVVINATSVTLDADNIVLANVGDTSKLTATVEPVDASRPTTWVSSNTSVVSVKNTGLVTAVSKGVATITVSNGQLSASCYVTVGIPISSLTLNKNNLFMKLDDVSTLVATILPKDATDQNVTWVSDSPDIVTVNNKGELKSVGIGHATITASNRQFSASCYVTSGVAVDSISLDKSNIVANIGETPTLKATVLPEDASLPKVTWESNSPTVVTVYDGKLTPLSPGNAVITATSSNGIKASCIVTVIDVKIRNKIAFGIGKSYKVISSSLDDSYLEKYITWSSSNNNIATVDKDGVVTGISSGTVQVKATSMSGEIGTCEVKVGIKSAAFSLSNDSYSIQIHAEGNFELRKLLQYTEYSSDADHNISVSCSNGDIVTVKNDGNYYIANRIGKAIVTLTSDNGNITELLVSVVEPADPIVHIVPNKTQLYPGDSTSFSIHSGDGAMTWTSSDPSVISIDMEHYSPSMGGAEYFAGVIAHKPGKATITATNEYGYSDQCEITVLKNIDVYEFYLTKHELTLAEGNSSNLEARVNVAALGDNDLVWSSSDPSIATVDQSGKVTGIKEGSTKISLSLFNGIRVESCDITVSKKVEMYRLYNSNSGEHFYTGSTDERDYLSSIGWNYEGVGWIAPEISNSPVFRMYNANGGEHHYTTSESERDSLVTAGWSYEGIGWYSADSDSVPLYRLYNPNAFANNHHYTTSEDERDYLISIGWKNEGIGWYGFN